MSFKVGDKVVCVRGVSGYLIEGNVYEITGVVNCSCGAVQQVSWGLPCRSNMTSCGCGKYHKTQYEHFCRSSRFRKVDESTNYKKTKAHQKLVREFNESEKQPEYNPMEIPQHLEL